MTRFVSLIFIIATLILFEPSHAQWVQTSGPLGGSVPVLLVDGTVVYAGTYQAGIFKSTDGGLSWQQLDGGFGRQTVVAMARCGPYLLASGVEGFYRSPDDGVSWTPIPGFDGLGGVSSIATQGTHAIAGTSYGGVYSSSDTGATWGPSNAGFPVTVDDIWISTATAAGSTYLVYGGTWDSMYVLRSTDLGATWNRADSGTVIPSQVLDLYFDGELVYAGGERVYSTTDGGSSWKFADGGLPDYPQINSFVRSGAKLFAGGYGGLFFSVDSGGSWTGIPGRLEHLRTLSLGSTGATLLAGTDGDGVYRSTDNGVTWTGSNAGLRARRMTSFREDGVTLYANGESIFRTGDGGANWTEVRGNLDDSAAAPNLAYAGGDTLFADGYDYNHFVRSVDRGATWIGAWTGFSTLGLVQDIVRTGSGFWTAVWNIYRSTNGGISWQVVGLTVTNGQFLSNIVVLNGALYAYGQGVFRSTNNGSTWEDVTPPATFQVDAMTAVGAEIYAADRFGGTIFRSTDGGTSWLPVDSPVFGGSVDQLYGTGTSLLLCSDFRGIFRTTDNGSTWFDITDVLPAEEYGYRVSVHDGHLYAGLRGNSVWRRPMSEVTAVGDHPDGVPKMTGLIQNYPNPFNPSTTIRWSTATTGRVVLKVFDVVGREVATPFDGVSEPGEHSVAWDAAGLPGGVYFCRMVAGSVVETKAMVLMR